MLKRAADLAEALYSMPRNPNQISLPPPRSPAINNSSPMSSFNTYTGQLAVSVQDPGGQWEEGVYNIRLYLQLFVGGLMSNLRYLCLFAYSGIQHIKCCA